MSLKDAIASAEKVRKENAAFKSNKWTPEKIRHLIETNTVFVERALKILTARQTPIEVRAEATGENNHMGYTATDAKFLTSLTKQVIENKYHQPEGKRLSHKQLDHARRRLIKYSQQLATYANYRDMVLMQQALGVSVDSEEFRKGGLLTPDIARTHTEGLSDDVGR